MDYVYLLVSARGRSRRCVGVTTDLKRRLAEHNSGKSPHTAQFKPWHLVTDVAFSDAQKAAEFERYLKSDSGHAFANRQLWWAYRWKGGPTSGEVECTVSGRQYRSGLAISLGNHCPRLTFDFCASAFCQVARK